MMLDPLCVAIYIFAAQEPSSSQPRRWRVPEKAGNQVTFWYNDFFLWVYLMSSCYREFRDYVQWLKGNYVPTEAKLRSMVESGFVFPETCKAILKPMEVNLLELLK